MFTNLKTIIFIILLGRQADKNGNINEWWTEHTLKKFSENLDCFKTHYQTYFDGVLKGISTDEKWVSILVTRQFIVCCSLWLSTAPERIHQISQSHTNHC